MTGKPPSGEAFHGVIGRTVHESKPWWPPSKVKPGAPNVVLVVIWFLQYTIQWLAYRGMV